MLVVPQGTVVIVVRCLNYPEHVITHRVFFLLILAFNWIQYISNIQFQHGSATAREKKTDS